MNVGTNLNEWMAFLLLSGTLIMYIHVLK